MSSVAAIERIAAIPTSDPPLTLVIDNRRLEAYPFAAEVANDGPCDVVNLQHEFGLYPGDWGCRILDFAAACKKPIVTTFHTLFPEPQPAPRWIVRELAARSRRVVVMTRIAALLLGVGEHMRFVNRYLSLPELLAHLQACDVFVTPYPGKDQIASGTMASAMAVVGAVISRSYHDSSAESPRRTAGQRHAMCGRLLEHARCQVKGFLKVLRYWRGWLDATGTGDCQGQAVFALAVV